MRDLDWNELKYVSGAGDSPTQPSGDCTCTCPTPTPTEKTKNNNGYGNGAESGPPPGNSGSGASFTGDNSGTRGAR